MSSTRHGKNGREIVMTLIAVITIAFITTAAAGLSNQPPVADSKGPYNGTEGVAITFNGTASYDPDCSIISFAWNFGDGNTGTGESPAYTYAQDGTYNVTLVVTDNEGATDTKTTTATIADTEPTADFAGTPTSGLKPLTVDFTDSSTTYDGIAAWEWDFGDGDTSSEQNPTHMYTTEGSYTVSFTVYEADGDSDTEAKVDYIIVTRENQPPVSDPNGPHTGTEGVAITFSGGGSYDPDGSIISFVWDFGFGDGNTGTGESPAYTYAQNGAYNVTLVVTDNEGATDTKTTTATIADTEPTADFAGTPTSGLKPLTVDFADSSASYDAISAWGWDFGDGYTSTEQNPTHVYTTEGTYTVSLTVYEADGDSDTVTKMDYINVTRENQPPVSDPNGPYMGTEGVAITFSGSGSYDPDGSIISFGWDFGFGDGNTSTGMNTTYTYAQSGTYNVTLVVTDNEGATDTNTTTATINDTEPTANFSASTISGLKPLTVNFTDSTTSYDGIAAWDWDFGDDNTSTEQNPTHVYITEGIYTVSFTGYEADGDSDTEAKVDYIIVTRENQLPVSDPNGPYSGTEGVAITFSGSGSYDPDGSIISYAWDFGFGDGNTGAGESPAHTYAQNGTYNVTLVVTDNEGATDTNATTATIADTKPTASFASTPTSGLKPLTVDFTDSSTSYDGIITREWDFGDGNASTEQNPTHMYTTEGIYTVSLTVYEADGDSDRETKADYIIVTRENQPPVSDPNGHYTGTEGAAILFSGSGSYDPDGSIISYAWDFGFGDGNTGTGESPAYTYAQNGTYNVTLVVTDNEGATDTKTTTATIADTEPTADFAGTPTSGLKPLTVDFADSSTSYDGIAAWEWDFGDGYTSTEQNPTHVYNSEGIYTVSFTVYEADGDSDTEAKVDYIIVTRENQPPVSDPNGHYTGTEGVAITFNASGSYDPDGSIISYGWDFGDGNTTTGMNTTYTYAQSGTYNVTLVVTDNEGATDTNTTTATINDTEPIANFSASTTSGLKPLTVNFSDSSTSYDGIAAWDWDFGDGNTSTEQNPTHVYITEGIYTVSLTGYEADGDSDTVTKLDYINVTRENQLPVSDPNGPYSGTEGVAITFSGSGSYDPDGSIISFAWDFGDGNTSTEMNATHAYAQNGTYNVTLVVTDSEGATDTSTTTVTISDAEPTADFSATTTSGLKPLTVDFSDSTTSYDAITAWGWDFGDGNTSTEQNPTHVYVTEGTYAVSLTVYEADGDSDTKAKADYIIVTRENQPPVSVPNGPYRGTEGAAILFSGSGSYDSDGGIASYAWDFGFGDGNTGTGESPAYTYAQNGIYNVTLVVTDNEGAIDTNTTTATIADTEPTADFSATPASGLKPLTVDFSDSSTSYDAITAWEWDFGDGNTSTEQNPTYVYATEGCYTVSLTAYEADGDSDTVTKVNYINVTQENQPPVSDPNGPYMGTEGVAITFSGSGSYDPDGSIISFAWDFGDGNTSTEMNATHTYAQDGTYNVTLIVVDNEGATDTNTTTAVIDDTEPIANLSFEINPSGINFGAVEIGIEKIVSLTITNTGNCPAKVTVTKCIMKGKTRGDTIPISALGVNGNYVDNPVIVSSSLGCNESVTLNLSIQVPVGTLADTYTEGFTITVSQP